MNAREYEIVPPSLVADQAVIRLVVLDDGRAAMAVRTKAADGHVPVTYELLTALAALVGPRGPSPAELFAAMSATARAATGR